MSALNLRTRRVVRAVFVVLAALSLAGAVVAGIAFEAHRMDMVLLQLVFYGAWWCLAGSWVGGYIGAAMEEDACSELDMGVLSSMGAILGTLSAGLIGTAVTGIGLLHSWWVVWGVTAALAALQLVFGSFRRVGVARLPHYDERGHLLGPRGERLPAEHQPLRMRDRIALLLAASVVLMLGLTLAMALMMGSDLGHPVMMAPMMYGMFGTMLGGMLGGWLAGLLDEHRGHPDHDNPVMVAAMALMAGMMGGMPSGMIGGMMAVMGDRAIGLTIAAGVLLLFLAWAAVVRGRYRFVLAAGDEAPRPALPPAPPIGRSVAAPAAGGAALKVTGMTCDVCVGKVTRGVAGVAGVVGVEVDLPAGVVAVRWAEGFAGLAEVRERITDLGYEVTS
jgi:copper chaperone